MAYNSNYGFSTESSRSKKPDPLALFMIERWWKVPMFHFIGQDLCYERNKRELKSIAALFGYMQFIGGFIIVVCGCLTIPVTINLFYNYLVSHVWMLNAHMYKLSINLWFGSALSMWTTDIIVYIVISGILVDMAFIFPELITVFYYRSKYPDFKHDTLFSIRERMHNYSENMLLKWRTIGGCVFIAIWLIHNNAMLIIFEREGFPELPAISNISLAAKYSYLAKYFDRIALVEWPKRLDRETHEKVYSYSKNKMVDAMTIDELDPCPAAMWTRNAWYALIRLLTPEKQQKLDEKVNEFIDNKLSRRG